jgi:hypothetical protein
MWLLAVTTQSLSVVVGGEVIQIEEGMGPTRRLSDYPRVGAAVVVVGHQATPMDSMVALVEAEPAYQADRQADLATRAKTGVQDILAGTMVVAEEEAVQTMVRMGCRHEAVMVARG